MTTPAQISDLVGETAVVETVDERAMHLVFQAKLDNVEVRRRWLELRANRPRYLRAVTITEVISETELVDNEEPGPDAIFRFSLEKEPVVGVLQVFLSSAIAKLAGDIAVSDRVEAADMDGRGTFTTHHARFQRWTLDLSLPYAPSEPLPDPRAYCRDFTTDSAVPSDIRPWLICAAPERSSMAYEGWRNLAARKLMAAAADHVSKNNLEVAYHFDGPPSRTVSFSDAELAGMYDRLAEGATWTFVNGPRDVDTRHLLLAAEWARSYRQEAPRNFGDGSLELASAAYSAYVKAGSRETLKALADLRKTVSDEAQKVSQRAQDLASALWKDLAVATAPFVLKILPDTSKASNQWIAGVLAVGAALFLVYSFSIQVFLNHRYLHTQKRARRAWRTRLNLFLSQSEVDELSEGPIRESVRDYRSVRLSVAFVYAVLIVVLLIFASLEFETTFAIPASPLTEAGAMPISIASPTKVTSPAATQPPKQP